MNTNQPTTPKGNHVTYVEILGVSGVGKTTIVNATKQHWNKRCSWVLDPTYHGYGPWPEFDGSRPVRFIQNYPEFAAQVFEKFAHDFSADSKKTAWKFIRIAAINRVFKKLEIAREFLNRDKVMILDEGLTLHSNLLGRETTIGKAEKLVSRLPMPSGYVLVEGSDADTIIRQLDSRASVPPLRKSLGYYEYKELVETQLQEYEYRKRLLTVLGVPLLVLNTHESTDQNARKVIEFAKKVRRGKLQR